MQATLDAARGAFPGRRLVLAFQPHRYTRTRDLFEDFVKVLSQADAVLLTEVYAASEQAIVAADGRALSRALQDTNLTMFGRYRVAQIGSFFHDLADLMGPTSSLADRGASIGHILMYAVAATLLYPVLDKLIQAVLGNKEATVARGGPIHVIENVEKVASRKMTPESFFFSTFIPSPLVTLAYEIPTNTYLWKLTAGFRDPSIVKKSDDLWKASMHRAAAIADQVGIASDVQRGMIQGPQESIAVA